MVTSPQKSKSKEEIQQIREQAIDAYRIHLWYKTSEFTFPTRKPNKEQADNYLRKYQALYLEYLLTKDQ